MTTTDIHETTGGIRTNADWMFSEVSERYLMFEEC